MNLGEIEDRVAAIVPSPGVEFLGELLLAYGLPKMSVARLMSGSTNRAEAPNERLLKGKVYFAAVDDPDDALYALIDAARDNALVLRYKPRFLIVKNRTRFLARDQENGETLDIPVDDLSANATFFMPWAGVEKTQLENLNYADVKAAQKMAKLYDEITRHNSIEGDDDVHDLNVFFSRLLFCFFAEDTGVFKTGSFTNAIGSYTQGTGADTHAFLDQLFEVLDRDLDDRDGVPEHLVGFGYVNGNLFARRSPAPRFSPKARAIVLECGTLDWSRINPDIFGSMMQAVVHPTQRAGLGMHYTSVENIMKVIRPLFLDVLEDALDQADTVKKLERLLERIADIRVFDPACGSGNFLVISYKELRKIEHRILQRLIDLDEKGRSLFKESVIRLDNFHGIEIDDFAHEIAFLSLWLAKHQMNVEFKELFGAEIPLIPLAESGNIVRGNATRLEWLDVCDSRLGQETYILGNPPYLGSSVQGPEQKADFAAFFGTRHFSRNLDYIALWFFKGAEYVVAVPRAEMAFVTTNSLSQGEQVGLVWPCLFEIGVRVSFAYESFSWANHARGNAGVTCVIVGLVPSSRRGKAQFYSSRGRQSVDHIGPYLRIGASDTVVSGLRRALSELPAMTFGSKATDGGFLILAPDERRGLLEESPDSEIFIRRYMGAAELLNGRERYCLWIPDEARDEALAVPGIAARVAKVAAFRQGSRKASTRELASSAHRFAEIRHQPTSAVIVPRHSSERREYIPMGFVESTTVVSDAANAIYDAEPWIFALLHSGMHMAWVRAVSGRIKTDFRYSTVLVYNTFPVPLVDSEMRDSLNRAGLGVLAAREMYAGLTLAQLYDPEAMPHAVRAAHTELDEIVDFLYLERPFGSDEERLALLFEMYEDAIGAQEVAHA